MGGPGPETAGPAAGLGSAVTVATPLPVSVIVPCHDAAQTIERAIGTVAAQTRLPTEVIAVDDASVDATAELLARMARQAWPFRFEAITLPENRGAAGARNAGWARADEAAAYIAFLDADDLWLPEKLERQIAWMEGRQEIAWTAHRCCVMGGAPSYPLGGSIQSTAPLTTRRLLARNSVATPTVVVRRGVRGRFRRGWRHCEDLMLWLDWLEEGARGQMLDVTLAELGRVPTSPGGSTGDLAAMYQGERRVISTLAAEGRLPELEAAAWHGYAWLRYLRRRVRS